MSGHSGQYSYPLVAVVTNITVGAESCNGCDEKHPTNSLVFVTSLLDELDEFSIQKTFSKNLPGFQSCCDIVD